MAMRHAAAALALLCCVAGCGINDEPRIDSSEERLYEGGKVVAVDSATDAVTWTDTVAVITVTSDRVVPGGEGAEQGASWMDGRLATFRIDKVLWSRPGTQQPPPTFECQVAGWFRSEGEQGIPMRDRHGVRFEVDRTYVAPIGYVFDQWGAWPSSSFEVVEGKIQLGIGQDSELAKALAGKPPEDVSMLFAEAKPDPNFSEHLNGTTAQQLEAIGVRAS